ncbi:MAG: Fic family protein [Sulfitobacter sp.]
MIDESRIRHSKADDAEVASDSVEVAKLEAANALRQTERVRQLILDVVDGKPFKLRPSVLLDLNRCAIEGLDAYAGVWRPAGIGIGASKHVPPGGHLVPELVEHLCDYINENWKTHSAVHLSSFVMWRLNWIHPFTEGNGRTSRAASYLVLCAKSGTLLPGTETIPEQIVANRTPYYDALEQADQRYEKSNSFDDKIVEKMEQLVGAMLAKQLKGAFDAANCA